MGTGASSTPSIYRTDAPNNRTHLRSQFDGELWDDLANVVFAVQDGGATPATVGTDVFVCSLSVPCPIKCRLEIHAMAQGGGGTDWEGFIRIDGVDTGFNSGLILQPFPEKASIAWFGWPDVEPGTHIVDLRLNLAGGGVNEFRDKKLMVRRGRTPQS